MTASTRPVPARASAVGDVPASAVMSSPVLVVHDDESLFEAWNLLFRSPHRHLVVVRGERVVAVIEDRQIAVEWPAGLAAAYKKRVRDVIRNHVQTITPETPLRQVARLMTDGFDDALPVVTAHGDLVGIVTARDLVRALADRS